jgi:hypothetical protein
VKERLMTDVYTERGLLREVLEHHDDDLPRQRYADWLEEHVGMTECPDCENESGYRVYCRTCEASGKCGWVPDGREARAEFIQVQLELAQQEAAVAEYRNADGPRITVPRTGAQCREWKAILKRIQELRQRQTELFAVHAKTWFADVNAFFGLSLKLDPAGVGATACVRRGFVERVRCRPEAFVEYAPVLFAGQPVVSVRLLDCEPWNVGFHGIVFNWWDGRSGVVAAHYDRSNLPGALFDAMYRLYPRQHQVDRRDGATHRWIGFDTRAEALAALERTCVHFGRSVAAGWTHELECENCEGTGALTEPAGPCPDCGGRWEPRDDWTDRGWSPGTGRVTRRGLAPLPV